MAMDPQRVILWLGVELAEKKSRIADLELQLEETNKVLEGALVQARPQVDPNTEAGSAQAAEDES